MGRVIIEIKSGVAYVVSIPVDVEVEVIDSDTRESDVYASIDSDTNVYAKGD